MAKPELGSKRQCLNCGAKFYDLNKDPIVCPKCATVFPAAALKGRPELVAQHVDEDEVETEVVAAEVVSLEEAEPAEEQADTATDEVEIVAGTDDTFLEQEEEGEDDVSGLIDGDIENDEEA